MSIGVWVSIVGIGALALVIYFLVVASPSEEDKRQADAIVRKRWSCPQCHELNDLEAEACGCGSARPGTATPAAPTSSLIPTTAPGGAGEPWRLWGWVLTLTGGAGLGVSLFLKTSVQTYVPASVLGDGGTSEVVNLDLLFQKGVAIAGSLTAIGLGLFCVGVSAIVVAIENAGKK